MKYILLLAFNILLFFSSSAQWTRPNVSYGNRQSRIDLDSTLGIPTFNGFPSSVRAALIGKAFLQFDSTDGKFYVYNPKTAAWVNLIDSARVLALLPTAGYGLTGTSVFKVDTTALKSVFGSSAYPTLQQVLTSGSTLTGHNTINVGGHNLTINNSDETVVQANDELQLVGGGNVNDSSAAYIYAKADSLQLWSGFATYQSEFKLSPNRLDFWSRRDHSNAAGYIVLTNGGMNFVSSNSVYGNVSIADNQIYLASSNHTHAAQATFEDGNLSLSNGYHNIQTNTSVDTLENDFYLKFPKYISSVGNTSLLTVDENGVLGTSTAYVPTSRTLTAGIGINTIGNLSSNRTISADTTSGGVQSWVRGLKIIDSMVAVNNSRYLALTGGTVSGATTFTSTVTTAGIISTGSAPTLTVAAGAGVGATASISGNSTDGVITLNTGAGSILALNALLTFTFPSALASSNYAITFTPGNGGSGGNNTGVRGVWAGNRSSSAFDISAGTSLAASTTYIFYYHIGQWQ